MGLRETNDCLLREAGSFLSEEVKAFVKERARVFAARAQLLMTGAWGIRRGILCHNIMRGVSCTMP